MDAQKRREKILTILRETTKPISGSRLAEELGVSRQIIVQDIAILRAGGEQVVATPQGYILISGLKGKTRKIFACVHGANGIKEELEIMISSGGKVLDVVVEHPLYGELRGLLMLETLDELKEYMKAFQEVKATPLSALTEGVHLHTVEADSSAVLEEISCRLEKRGFLLDQV